MAERVVEDVERGDTVVIVLDPHRRSLAFWILMALEARGLTHRVLFDRLSYSKRVLSWKFLEPSKAKDELSRRSQNDERVGGFTEILCSRRGTTGLEKNPQTEEWVHHALALFIEQEEELPLSVLPSAFVPNSPIQRRMIDRCRDEAVAARFRAIASGQIRRGQYAPAERLIHGTFTTPAFQVRCGSSFNLGRFLRKSTDPGVLLIEGGSIGNVSFNAMRTVLCSFSHKAIQHVRNRSKPIPRIHIVYDEASAADLIGLYECRALAETQKMGLDISVLTQNLNFSNSFVQDALLQNCLRHEWFYCGNSALAALGAADLGDKALKGTLMTQARGARQVKLHRRVFSDLVTPLEDKWHFPGLAQKSAEIALNQIRTRPEYQDGVLEMNASKSDPRTTSVRQTSSREDSSPLDRLGIDE